MTHCWQGLVEHIEETCGHHSPEHLATYADSFRSGTCMLEDGHAGPHEFTMDAEIGVAFAVAEEAN